MNELAQCYANSCATYEYRSVKLTPGLFAVVDCCLAHCPVTDATLPGCNRYLVAEYGSRRIAEYFAAKRAKELDQYDECWIEVLPKAAQPQVQTRSDTEIPF